MLKRPQPLGAQTAFAVGLQIIGEHRMHQHRHVAEDIVEDVGLLEVVELRSARRMNCPGREAAMREMVEEHLGRHEPRHGHDLPTGTRRHQHLAEPAEIEDRLGADRQRLHPGDIIVAGPAPGSSLALAAS